MATNEITEYMRKPESIERFADVTGSAMRANRYIQSVLIAVTSNDELMKCTPRSVMSSALRCASLQLSCDPALKQGQLVPFKNWKNDQMEAALIIHYVGLTILAERTNKYRTINVTPIYEGWEVMENIYTGLHAVSIPGLGMLETGYAPRWNMKETPVIGYLGYFETVKGFKKSVYMTIEEIEEHAKKFSKGYGNQKSIWKDPKHKPTMQMKTVVRALAKWMDLGSSSDALTQAINDFEGDEHDYETLPENGKVIEVESNQLTEPEALAELGFSEAGKVPETIIETESDPFDDLHAELPVTTKPPATNGNGTIKPFKGNIIEQWILEGYFDDKPSAVSVLNRSPFKSGLHTLEAVNAFGRLYRSWRDAGLEADAAIERATAGEVPA